MKIVGLTGGIGSGKTTVAKQFMGLGIPVYIADEEAKKLMATSKIIQRKLIQLFGNEAYMNNQLNKPYIANIIFNDKTYLQKMNAIVHPKVAQHFKKWVLKQTSPYIIKEVAILFETGGNKECDKVILITAPVSLRIERAMKRDNLTKDEILVRINNQLSDEEKIKMSDFVVENINLKETFLNIDKILKILAKS